MNKVLPLRVLISYASRGISPQYVENNGLIVINQKCIRNNKVQLEQSRLTDRAQKFTEEKRLIKFDILINSTGVGTLGRVAQLTKDLDATVDSHVSIFRTADNFEGEKIDPRFIGYAVQFREKEIEALGKGATGQTELSKDSVLDDVSVFFPRFQTQRTIASILSSYDDLIENNEKRIKILEEMAQRLYVEWFVKFNFPGHEKVKIVNSQLGKIPEGWEVKTLKDLGQVVTGKTPPTAKEEFFGNDVLFIKTPDMHGKIFVTDTEQKLSSLGEEFQKAKTLPEKTVFVSCIGTLGLVGITSKKSQTNQQINAIIADNNKAFPFIYFLTKSLKQKLKNLGANGATMGNVNKDKFENIKFISPRDELLDKYSSFSVAIFDQILNLQKQNTNLVTTRDLLIPQLVTGRRVLKS